MATRLTRNRTYCVGLFCLLIAGLSFAPSPVYAEDESAPGATFATVDEAVDALISAVREDGTDGLVAVLGSEGEELADSGDPVADAERRQHFVAAYEELHRIEKDDDDSSTLIVGKEEYPFPIPLVREEAGWRWDTDAGFEEIIARRIGENELSVIEVMDAVVDAQLEYAQGDRDGAGPQYARKILSSDGKRDGLYWPASSEGGQSPLGPLIAKARSEGYSKPDDAETPAPYHGYLYRILLSQGPNAAGGAREYVINGRMIGGFGLIATPAEYGNSGIMTFIVNQNGQVFQKDLGPETAREAEKIDSFDPDETWEKVEPQ
jgi:Protein of unknown function (DUF2950)